MVNKFVSIEEKLYLYIRYKSGQPMVFGCRNLEISMELIYAVFCNISVIILGICSYLLFRDSRGQDDLSMVGCVFAFMALVFGFWALALYGSVQPPDASSFERLILYLFLVSLALTYPARALGRYIPILSGVGFLSIYVPVAVLFGFYQVALYGGVEFPAFAPLEALVDGSLSLRLDQLFRFVVYLTTVALSLTTLACVFRYLKGDKILCRYTLAVQLFLIVMSMMFLMGGDPFVYISVNQFVISVAAIFTTNQLLRSAADGGGACRVVASRRGASAVRANGLSEPKYRGGNPLLWSRLEGVMLSGQEPWRKRDLHISELATMLHSNRTSVSAEIHYHGYASFYDYLATYRIAEFCRMVERGEVTNIWLSLHSVGFHSESSAFKQFKRIHGVSPSQYIANLTPRK